MIECRLFIDYWFKEYKLTRRKYQGGRALGSFSSVNRKDDHRDLVVIDSFEERSHLHRTSEITSTPGCTPFSDDGNLVGSIGYRASTTALMTMNYFKQEILRLFYLPFTSQETLYIDVDVYFNCLLKSSGLYFLSQRIGSERRKVPFAGKVVTHQGIM